MDKGSNIMEYENIISELNEITTSLDATTETLVGLQENAKHEEAIKKIDVDLYLEAPIQELSRFSKSTGWIKSYY